MLPVLPVLACDARYVSATVRAASSMYCAVCDSASSITELKRSIATQRLRNEFQRLCADVLKINPPRESFNRWVMERHSRILAVKDSSDERVKDPLIPTRVLKGQQGSKASGATQSSPAAGMAPHVAAPSTFLQSNTRYEMSQSLASELLDDLPFAFPRVLENSFRTPLSQASEIARRLSVELELQVVPQQSRTEAANGHDDSGGNVGARQRSASTDVDWRSAGPPATLRQQQQRPPVMQRRHQQQENGDSSGSWRRVSDKCSRDGDSSTFSQRGRNAQALVIENDADVARNVLTEWCRQVASLRPPRWNGNTGAAPRRCNKLRGRVAIGGDVRSLANVVLNDLQRAAEFDAEEWRDHLFGVKMLKRPLVAKLLGDQVRAVCNGLEESADRQATWVNTLEQSRGRRGESWRCESSGCKPGKMVEEPAGEHEAVAAVEMRDPLRAESVWKRLRMGVADASPRDMTCHVDGRREVLSGSCCARPPFNGKTDDTGAHVSHGMTVVRERRGSGEDRQYERKHNVGYSDGNKPPSDDCCERSALGTVNSMENLMELWCWGTAAVEEILKKSGLHRSEMEMLSIRDQQVDDDDDEAVEVSREAELLIDNQQTVNSRHSNSESLQRHSRASNGRHSAAGRSDAPEADGLLQGRHRATHRRFGAVYIRSWKLQELWRRYERFGRGCGCGSANDSVVPSRPSASDCCEACRCPELPSDACKCRRKSLPPWWEVLPEKERDFVRCDLVEHPGGATGASESHGNAAGSAVCCLQSWADFKALVWRLLIRYNALFGSVNRREGRGLQGALPRGIFELLEGELGVEIELFASSLNATLPQFFAAFPDIEKPFGCIGDFFDPSVCCARGSFQANPPFDERVLERMAANFLHWLVAAEQRGDALSFCVVVPDWSNGAAPYLDALLVSAARFVRQVTTVEAEKHGYVDGFQHRAFLEQRRCDSLDAAAATNGQLQASPRGSVASRRVGRAVAGRACCLWAWESSESDPALSRHSPCGSKMIFLQTTKGALRWPAADVTQRITEVWGAPLASGHWPRS